MVRASYRSCSCFVAFLADMIFLFDDLIGYLLQMPRHVEGQRLGGLKIDEQFVLRRLLYR
jgi:hypothetical protein